MTTVDPRYPIGKFDPKDSYSSEEVTANINRIAALPEKMKKALQGLTDAQLDTPYRDGGWTVRQVVHHVPDSHLNAYVRMKLAVTEDTPAVKTYDETRWAELHEARTAPVDMSLALLESLHRRWVLFMRGLSDVDFSRAVMHPEWGRIDVAELLALYSWHCRHHEGHVRLGLGEGSA